MACLLDVVGDRWTLLVVRDLMLGRSRFGEFLESPEGIPTNLLSDRLARLVEHGMVDQVPVGEGARRMAYRLTEKGEALRPLLRAMRDWGLAWEAGTEAALGPVRLMDGVGRKNPSPVARGSAGTRPGRVGVRKAS